MQQNVCVNLKLHTSVPQAYQDNGGGGGGDNAIAHIIHDTVTSHIAEMKQHEVRRNKHMQEHACCKDCNMEELDVHYEYSTCSGNLEIVVNPSVSPQAPCNSKMQPLKGLFVCPASGKLHLCGPGRCTLSGGHGVCEDGSCVCLLTGIIVDSGDWIGKTWQQDDLDRGSGEHLSWKTDKQHSKKEAQGEKLWNSQFDSLKAEVLSFRTLLCELFPGGSHCHRIHAKINEAIVKRCKLRILNCIKRSTSAKGNMVPALLSSSATTSVDRTRRQSIDIMKIKQIILCAVRKCYIECNGLRVMCVTPPQRRSIANAYTASIFNLYNEMSTSKWNRVKGDGGDNTVSKSQAPPRRTMRFVQFGFNVLMLSQSGLCFNNNQVIKEDTFLKSALPCVHHIMKDDKLLSDHPYIKYMAKSTKRMISMFKAQTVLPFLKPVDARASACSHTELNFCAQGYHGTQQQFTL